MSEAILGILEGVNHGLMEKNSSFVVKFVKKTDLDQVLRIQKACYAKYLLEDRDTYVGYIDRFDHGCIAIFTGDTMAGYCFSFPFQRNHSITYPSQSIATIDSPNCYYLHDMAIDPEFRNRNLSTMVYQVIESIAIHHNHNVISLTAVNNQRIFWGRHGFQTISKIHHQDRHVADLMEKSLHTSKL